MKDIIIPSSPHYFLRFSDTTSELVSSPDIGKVSVNKYYGRYTDGSYVDRLYPNSYVPRVGGVYGTYVYSLFESNDTINYMYVVSRRVLLSAGAHTICARFGSYGTTYSYAKVGYVEGNASMTNFCFDTNEDVVTKCRNVTTGNAISISNTSAYNLMYSFVLSEPKVVRCFFMPYCITSENSWNVGVALNKFYVT